MKVYWLGLVCAAIFLVACHTDKEVKLLQFNIWQEGTSVDDGFPAIVENILALDPDLVTFSEVRNYKGVFFIPHLLAELEKRGVKYYGEESVSTGILSKYKIQSQEVVYPLKEDRGSVIKAHIRINGRDIVLYSAHLDWLRCSSYLPRGYDGSTWKPLERPVVDKDSILADNRSSFRDDEVRAIIADARIEREQGRLVLIGGDFNEPSHLDWQADTKDIRDHQGLVINWDCSRLLAEAGYQDAFREIYPDPVAYPGFTFPANNPAVDMAKLVWAKEADERERIDFIYYVPDPSVVLKDVWVVGPVGSVLRGERTEKDLDSQDPFVVPSGVWPTDHKALLATFKVRPSASASPTPTVHQSAWQTADGWVLRKEPGSDAYKRFFAIGLWNIPGYQSQAMDTKGEAYRESSRPYLNKSELYNMVFMNPGNDKDACGRVEIAGTIPFYETLLDYQKGIPCIDGNDPYWQYKARRLMREHIDDPAFERAFDLVIDSIVRRHGPVDHIWAPIDEIVQGGAGADWTWYPEIGEKIKERIKVRENHTLVYADLAGMPRGNYYLFEKNYLKDHARLPDTPPFEALGKDAKILETRPTLGFFQGYNGHPVYKNGTDDYTPLDLEALKDLFYNNMKICAADYRKCGDVFGLNAFMDCNNYPVLAGVAVDAIKAGVGESTPVWLFFDGNGYARPEDESPTQFVRNLKCQIYTSIIHGATGILFWNDREKPADVFSELEPVIREITDRQDILYMNTREWKSEGDLHYMIKEEKGKSYVIASNTSKSDTVTLRLPGQDDQVLQPLEVVLP